MSYHMHNNEDTHRGLKRKPPHMDRGQERRPYNTNSRPYDRNTVPDGWLDCPPHGQEIGCIIPSKVPLGDSFNDYIPSQKYAPKQAIHQQRVLGRELGLVIDLTNTTRYYPVSDWTKEGIGHVKIRCTGRDAVPDDESVKFFCDKVLDFCSQRTNTKKYILVHCTHGHNRTGYMIVHFLVRTESLSVTEAINKFACARHPGIYKQDYIDALYMFYNEKKPEDLVCPQTPEWKRISDPDFHGTAVPAVDNSAHIPEQERIVRNEVLTSDDALGDPIPPNQLRPMQELCYQLLKLGTGGRGRSFPGSHPVSLNRDNLQLLRQRYYYATWKADGTRYMMLITCDVCYLIDRKFFFQRINMRFPCRYTNGGTPERNHHYTLLDGEMIIDTDPHTHKQERRYLIYDLMAINQVSLTEVRRKGFWLLSTVSKLLHKFIPQLSHSSDGLVFQGWDDPYVPRTHEGLLKWKYPEMNSVDFLCEVGAGDRPLLFLFERGRKKLMEENVIFKDASDISSYSGKIIECYWDSAEHHWVCMRIRIDKAAPNDINTYRKVMRSIKDNITEEVLLNEINQIIRLPLYADRIQRDIKAHQHMISSRRKYQVHKIILEKAQ
ncbi:mRNA-capping enzyme isoform X3 [Glycine max]|uniref:mRNA-capping enzyme isoform X3 n=1 Tax=Glycine max TaxID=3847 RepID=UPI001B356D77|nr:mRNA-capping enzyme isoform X3 [Glycine max]